MAVVSAMIATGDISRTLEVFRAEHGLGSVPGPELGNGLACEIVPLRPPQYVQIVFLRDVYQALGNHIGQWLMNHSMSQLPAVAIGWVIESSDLDREASRLGTPPQSQISVWPDGTKMAWRSISAFGNFGPLPIIAEFETSLEERTRFFERLARDAQHAVEPGGFSYVETGGDADRQNYWISGNAGIPVKVRPGGTSLYSVGVDIDGKEVSLP
jgi:hypothetical protein